MKTGEKIQKCRKEKGISQEELAAVIGVSRQALSKWECQSASPDYDKLVALSEYFGVSTDYLLKDNIEEAAAVKADDKSVKVIGSGMVIALSITMIIAGLLIAYTGADDGTIYLYWDLEDSVPGLLMQIVGVGVYEILYFSGKMERKGQEIFWGICCWLLTVMPAIFAAGYYISLGFIGTYDTIHVSFYVGCAYVIFNALITVVCIMFRIKRRTTRK